MMRIAYARVSTDKQELHRQLDALEKVGYDKLIQEKFTGTQKKRVGLDTLFNSVRSGDTVIIESISRLGRKTLDILSTVEELKEQGVEVVSLKENLDTSTPTGQAMFQMMAVIAQSSLYQKIKERDSKQILTKAMEIFGNSSETITKRYIGINEDEISTILLNFRLGF